MPKFFRALMEETEGRGEPGDPIRFSASTPGEKRDGKDLNQNLWFLDNYRANPVVLWVHDYMGYELPIGRADVIIDEGELVADVLFDQQDDFARKVESKYRRGFLNAVSVGWDEIEIEGQARYDLLDISGVPVPGDPDALIQRQRVALRSFGRELLDEFKEDAPDPEPTEIIITGEVEEFELDYDLLAEKTARALQELSEITPPDDSDDFGEQYETARALITQLAENEAIIRENARILNDGLRAGAVLSKRNKERLEQAVNLINEVLTPAVPEDEPDERVIDVSNQDYLTSLAQAFELEM